MAETVWDIKSIALFDGLNPAQVHNLIDIAQKVEYNKGSVVFRYGDKSREIYILIKGLFEVLSENRINLYFLKEKEIFGEIGFVSGMDRNATVVAREESVALVITHNLLENLSNTDPLIKPILLHNMVASLGHKLTQANRRIERLTLENIKLKAQEMPPLPTLE